LTGNEIVQQPQLIASNIPVIESIPEPSSFALLGLGVLAMSSAMRSSARRSV